MVSRNMALFLDALRYSFQMVHFHKDEVDRILPILEENESVEEENESIAIRLILNLWGIIDTAHRVRELIQQVPGLKKNTPQIQVFLRSTESVEDLRNYIQHLRTGISKIPEKSTPLWGVISWVSDKRKDMCFTISTGSAPDVSVHTCAYDTWKKEFAQKLIISVNENTVEINHLLIKLAELNLYIRTWAEGQGYTYENRRLPILTFSVAI
jgi:hypothetical protein